MRDIEDIVLRCNAGQTYAQVAKRYNLTRCQVAGIVYRNRPDKIRIKQQRAQDQAHRVAQAVERYVDGMTIRQAMQGLCGDYVLANELRRLGLMRSKGRRRADHPSERNASIVKLHQHGMTLSAIGRVHGLSTSRVHRIIQRWSKTRTPEKSVADDPQ